MFDIHFHWYPKDLLERAREAYPHHGFLRLPFEKLRNRVDFLLNFSFAALVGVLFRYLMVIL